MLKKLVIVGSLLAVGPLLAGCPGGVVSGVTQGDSLRESSREDLCHYIGYYVSRKAFRELRSRRLDCKGNAAAEERIRAFDIDQKFASKKQSGKSPIQPAWYSQRDLSNFSDQALCSAYKSNFNDRFYKKRIKLLLIKRGRLSSLSSCGAHGRFFKYLSKYENMSKAELCHQAKFGGQFTETAKEALRIKNITCDQKQTVAIGCPTGQIEDMSTGKCVSSAKSEEQQRLRKAQRAREAQRARRAAVEQKKREDARRQAKAKREAEERRQAEAKRKAEAAKKAKLYRVGSGSGFSISRDGLIVTNHHVIDGCSAVAVSDKGEMYRAIVQSVDERNDLALLKSKLRPTHVFALNPEGTDILREIYVAGYPFGRMVSNSVKVTKGIVSSLVGLENNSAQIQIDAPIQVGNSGGPILDSEGRVVGVSVSKLDAFEVMKKKKQIPEGVGFGVKSETLIQMLKSSGVRTYKRGGLKTTAEIANAIRGGTFYISCLMTAERYKRLKDKKAMFEGSIWTS